MRYMPCCDPDPAALAVRLREVKSQELRAGFCLTGPHREDLEILIDGQPGKIYGSQGQQRSAVLSLKLAEATVAGDVLGEHPVMLLDDVLSELDDARQTYLLTRIEDKQTFVTTCDSAAFARTTGKLVFVEAGRVRDVYKRQGHTLQKAMDAAALTLFGLESLLHLFFLLYAVLPWRA